MTTVGERASGVRVKPEFMVVTRDAGEEVLRIKPLELESSAGASGTSYERLSPGLPVPKYFTFDGNDIVGLGDSTMLPSDGVVEPASSLFPKLAHGDVVAVGEKLTRLKPIPLGAEEEDATAGLGHAIVQETQLFKVMADKFKTFFTYSSDAEVSPVYKAITSRIAGNKPVSVNHTIRFLQHYDNMYGIPVDEKMLLHRVLDDVTENGLPNPNIPEDRAQNISLTPYQRQVVTRLREAVPRPV